MMGTSTMSASSVPGGNALTFDDDDVGDFDIKS